jgi:hypothetical protein
VRFVLAFGCVLFVLLSAACDDDGENSDDTPPAATSTLDAATAGETPEPQGTPANAALIDDVIDLAVQLGTMTREQAVCVFQDHPIIYQEFVQESGLVTSGTVDEATVTQQIEDLKREHAVQLAECFRDLSG